MNNIVLKTIVFVVLSSCWNIHCGMSCVAHMYVYIYYMLHIIKPCF